MPAHRDRYRRPGVSFPRFARWSCSYRRILTRGPDGSVVPELLELVSKESGQTTALIALEGRHIDAAGCLRVEHNNASTIKTIVGVDGKFPRKSGFNRPFCRPLVCAGWRSRS